MWEPSFHCRTLKSIHVHQTYQLVPMFNWCLQIILGRITERWNEVKRALNGIVIMPSAGNTYHSARSRWFPSPPPCPSKLARRTIFSSPACSGLMLEAQRRHLCKPEHARTSYIFKRMEDKRYIHNRVTHELMTDEIIPKVLLLFTL